MLFSLQWQDIIHTNHRTKSSFNQARFQARSSARHSEIVKNSKAGERNVLSGIMTLRIRFNEGYVCMSEHTLIFVCPSQNLEKIPQIYSTLFDAC